MYSFLFFTVVWAASEVAHGYTIPDHVIAGLRFAKRDVKGNECAYLGDGVHRNPASCTSFIQCANGRKFIQNCGPGTHFNAAVKVCDWPSSANCKVEPMTIPNQENDMKEEPKEVSKVNDGNENVENEIEEEQLDNNEEEVKKENEVDGHDEVEIEEEKLDTEEESIEGSEETEKNKEETGEGEKVKKVNDIEEDKVGIDIEEEKLDNNEEEVIKVNDIEEDKIGIDIEEEKLDNNEDEVIKVNDIDENKVGIHIEEESLDNEGELVEGSEVVKKNEDTEEEVKQENEVGKNDKVEIEIEEKKLNEDDDNKSDEVKKENEGSDREEVEVQEEEEEDEASKEFSCNKAGDGNYFDPGKCSSYIQCEGGRMSYQSCPSGLHFNDDLKVCDQSKTDKCSSTDKDTINEGKQETELDCGTAGDGIHANPSDCSTFIQCAHGQNFKQNCPAGLHFNANLKVCDWPDSAKCIV